MSDRCSFCGKPQECRARVYICDECVGVCATVLEEERAQAEGPVPVSEEKHPLLEHPLASNLLAAIERWVRRESLGGDGAAEIAEVRTIAAQMMGT